MSDKLSFQVIDARDYHESASDSDTSEGEELTDVYYIRLFGRTALNDTVYPDKSVCCTIKGFTPFFFVKLPVGWTNTKVKTFYSYLSGINKKLQEYKVIEKRDFDGFHGDDTSKFIQLIFQSSKAMKNTAYLLTSDRYWSGKKLVEYKFELYESNIDPVIKFMHIKNLRGCSWAKISTTKIAESEHSTCEVDVECHWTDVQCDQDSATAYSRLRILSYDIEVMSSDPDGGFPQAHREGDKVIQVGLTYNYYQQNSCYFKQLLTLDTCEPIQDVEVISLPDERSLLSKFVSLILEQDPDIICGYNIFGFDNKYLHDRAARFGSNFASSFSRWSRLTGVNCSFLEKKLSSSALGDNILYMYESDGRVQIDLLKVVQRDHNLESYKLDFVSSHFNQNAIKNLQSFTFETPNTSGLEAGGYFHIKTIDKTSGVEDLDHEKYQVVSIDGKRVVFTGKPIELDMTLYDLKWTMAKDDIPPKKIFEYFKIDAYHRSLVGKYCIKDCVLVNFLMEKLDVISNNIAMSNVCWVPLYYIFIRGQGIKSFSLVAQQCRQAGYLIPALKKENFTNQKDRHFGEYNIVDIDMCTFEGCRYHAASDTPIKMKEYIDTKDLVCPHCERVQYYTEYEGAKVFEPIPGVYWEPITVLDYASLYPRSIISRNMSWETQVFTDRYDNLPNYKYYEVSYKDSRGNTVNCKFAQKKDGTLGIIPKILFNLLDERDATKKLMKHEKDPFKKKILDGHQLALKVTANSLYGQLGAITSPVYRKDIAACTTAVGQQMLGIAQQFVEERLVPMLDEIDSEEVLKRFLPNHKDVSEEWQLIKNIKDNYTMVPKVIYGDSVTSDTPILVRKNNHVYVKVISELGKDWVPYEYFKPWESNLREKEQSLTDFEVWTDGKWSPIKRVIRHKTKKSIFRVQTERGVVDTTEDHSLMTDKGEQIKPKSCVIGETLLLHSFPEFDKAKNKSSFIVFNEHLLDDIPDWVLNADFDTRTSFLDRIHGLGIHESVLKSALWSQPVLHTRSKLIAAKWYYFLCSLGHEMTIDEIQGLYVLKHASTLDKNFKVKSLCKVRETESDEYVYDLETEAGIFQAGIGQIIVKNTDSVFVNLQMKNKMGETETDREARVRCMKVGMLAGELIKPLLDYPHDLEYDKTFHPWLVVCKKKYAGPKYEEDPDKFHMTYMGIVLKRRDNAKIVKKVCGGILNILLKEKDYKKVEMYTKEILDNIIENKFDITYFVTTKTLKGYYKGKKLSNDSSGKIGDSGTWSWYDVNCTVSHVQLCQKMRKRDPGSAPQVNDRVSYVQVVIPDKGKKKILQGDKIEEVSFVLNNNLNIDFNYYIANQIMTPACQFLELIMKNPEEKLFKPVLDELEFRKNRRTKILEKMKSTQTSFDFCTIEF